MYNQVIALNKTVQQLRQYKSEGKKFSTIAAYDATFARTIADAGIDCIIVGDSLGMVVQGKSNTLNVSTELIAYHTEAVANGNNQSGTPALIVADMPFMSYQDTSLALENAAQLIRAGANMVKLEGGSWLAETIEKLVQCGIPVCAHLGLTPQSINKLGGFSVQGKSDAQREQLITDALALEAAGADFIVLECIPSDLATQVTNTLSISTIGIGAGAETDAQVLVAHDLLGLAKRPARFVKNFLSAENIHSNNAIRDAFAAYDQAVKQGNYPAQQHQYG